MADAHRIVALRDLGLGLEQITALVAEDVSVERLRGMLRLRQAEIATSIREEQERLQRVEAHLDAIEHHHRIIVKQTDPIRVALSTYKAAGYGYENIFPIFDQHLEGITTRLLELPIVEVAATVHRGPMNDILSVYKSMVRWIEASGFQLAGNGRELYRNIGVEESEMVTEVQLPVVRAS